MKTQKSNEKMSINVWETYNSGISTPTQKIDLDITGLVFQEYLWPLSLTAQNAFPLLAPCRFAWTGKGYK